MISRLQGTLIEKDTSTIIMDVHGVGYAVDVPLSTFCALPAVGEALTLWTHLSVREDAQQLFGFHEREARRTFLQLIKVSGVGPKLALTILSGMDVNALRACIQHEDIAQLTRIPGIGKKTAERLIIELRDTIAKETPSLSSATAVAGSALLPPASANDEAISALIGLGYKPTDAKKAVDAVAAQHTDTADILRAALKGLMRS